jgi:hypothetical protein
LLLISWCLYKHSQGTVEYFSCFFCHSSSSQASVRNSAGLLYILQCTFCDSSAVCACLLNLHVAIFWLSLMVMQECGVCYFLLSVERASYQPLHMLCTGVKQVGEFCGVTWIVLLALKSLFVLTNEPDPLVALVWYEGTVVWSICVLGICLFYSYIVYLTWSIWTELQLTLAPLCPESTTVNSLFIFPYHTSCTVIRLGY